jgi:tRNA A-37 threonylcarbamoyl transferase component Bud32
MTPPNPPALSAEPTTKLSGEGERRVIGLWRWEVEPGWAGDKFRTWLADPNRLLGRPAEIIARIPPNPNTRVARVQVPEHPRPLIVKYSTPRGIRQIVKDWFRHSRAVRAFRLAKLLEEAGIPTARHLAAGEKRFGRHLEAYCLIMEEVTGFRSWYDYDNQFPDRAHRVPVIRAFGRMLAMLHNAGYTHADPVRTNFMIRLCSPSHAEMVLIDLDGVQPCEHVSPEMALEDLRHALARTPATVREHHWFLTEYCRSRNPRLSPRELRWELLPGPADKLGGLQSDELAIESRGNLPWHVRRPLVHAQSEAIMNAPDEFLTRARVLKPSRSSAVSAQDGLVLKRYNFRKWRNLLKDLFRGSKARRCFFRAIHLELAGIPTARVLAFAEQRHGGVPLRSYLLMEEIPSASTLFDWKGDKQHALQSLARLLARLHDAGFTHRDLKEGNILVNGRGEPFLVDLDGLHYVRRVKDDCAAADLARLAEAAVGQPRLTRSDFARFLRAYCRTRRLGDWRLWWRKKIAGGRARA